MFDEVGDIMALFGSDKNHDEEDDERIDELEQKIAELEADVKSRDLVIRATNNEVLDLTSRMRTYEDMLFESKTKIDVLKTYESFERMDAYLNRLNPMFKFTALLETVTEKAELTDLVIEANRGSLKYAVELEENQENLASVAEIQKRRDALEAQFAKTTEEIQRHAAMEFAEIFNDKTLSNYFKLSWGNGGFCIDAYVGFDDDILFIPEKYKNEPINEVCESLFLNCRTLKTLVVEAPIKIIPKSFAEGCKVERVILPDTVTRIEVDAFQGSELRSIDLGNGLQRIGESAFKSSQLMSVVFPNTVSVIGKNAFADTKLQKVRTPAFLKVLQAEVFESCGELMEVVLNDGLERIESCVFRRKFIDNGKPTPKVVTIPESVTYIESDENAHTFRPFHKNTVIKCYSGSHAQQWARENGYAVKRAEEETGRVAERAAIDREAEVERLVEEKLTAISQKPHLSTAPDEGAAAVEKAGGAVVPST